MPASRGTDNSTADSAVIIIILISSSSSRGSSSILFFNFAFQVKTAAFKAAVAFIVFQTQPIRHHFAMLLPLLVSVSIELLSRMNTLIISLYITELTNLFTLSMHGCREGYCTHPVVCHTPILEITNN